MTTYHVCDVEGCNKQLIQGRDLYDGELDVYMPKTGGGRNEFILRIRATSSSAKQQTNNDICREHVIAGILGEL